LTHVLPSNLVSFHSGSASFDVAKQESGTLSGDDKAPARWIGWDLFRWSDPQISAYPSLFSSGLTLARISTYRLGFAEKEWVRFSEPALEQQARFWIEF
jgi:hypothetical protein